jgi:hypothetical protein
MRSNGFETQGKKHTDMTKCVFRGIGYRAFNVQLHCSHQSTKKKLLAGRRQRED